MSAKKQAFKDIQKELTFVADSDDFRRKKDSGVWFPYSESYSYEMNISYSMRISHLKTLLKYGKDLII